MKVKLCAILFLLLILIATGGVVQAQRATPTSVPTDTKQPGGDTETESSTSIRGSIRGTVFEDTNGDGKCQGTDEPALAGIPIDFGFGPDLYSGDDGSYGLVSAELGYWQVSAAPPAGYVVTSEKTVTVLLDEKVKVVADVDFCVSNTSSVKVLLPESGAPMDLVTPRTLVALAGVLFVITGLGIQWRASRRS